MTRVTYNARLQQSLVRLDFIICFNSGEGRRSEEGGTYYSLARK